LSFFFCQDVNYFEGTPSFVTLALFKFIIINNTIIITLITYYYFNVCF